MSLLLQLLVGKCRISVRGRQRGAQRRAISRHRVLPRPHVDLPDHAHLQMLGWRDVAVPHVGARLGRQVVVGEAAADVDRHRRVRHAVVEGRGVRVAVEVDGVLLEQVGSHHHADVGEREEKLVALVDGDRRRRDVAVEHTHVHGQPRIDVTAEAAGGHQSDLWLSTAAAHAGDDCRRRIGVVGAGIGRWRWSGWLRCRPLATHGQPHQFLRRR